MMKYLLLLNFILNIVTVFSVEKIICDSRKNININENEIIFFESPNFPFSIDENAKENCKLIINGTSKKENMEILLVFTKAKFKNGRIRITNGTNPTIFNKNKYSKAGYHHTDASMMIFDFSKNNTKSWEVFQGFITYEPGSTKLCPLANKDQPFKISNEAEPLYIRSSYKKDALLYEKKCTWKFEAPKNHSFKIKIQQLESEVLIISGTAKHITLTAITISHTTTLNKNHTFEAKISVVNLTKIHKSDDCKFIENIKENTAIWTREENDFDNKIKCRRNVTVISGHQLYANITLFDLEQGVDALRYYDNDTELLHPIEILENDAYVFLPFSENENRSITFEFTSDESIIYKNFSIKFSSVECKCTEENFIIPCDEERTFTIMGGENELYCANLSCSSTIQIHDSCPDKSILLKLFPYFANPDCDYLHLINDKEVLINTSDISTKFDESTIQTALILPNRSTYFNFKSFSGTRIDKVSGAVINVGIGKLRIWTKPLSEPKLRLQKITAADPLYIFKSSEMEGNSILTAFLSEELLQQNDSLELVYETSNAQHLLKCLTLYDKEDLSSIRKLNLYNYTTSIGSSVTIYKHINCEYDVSKLIIRAKYAHSLNCVFQNNLINVENIMKTKNKIISMIAGSQKSCDLTLVNNVGQYFIKQVWTKTDENVLLFNNANINKAVLEFNNVTAIKWKQMTFNALSYTLEIPANNSVIIEFFYSLYKIYLNYPHFSYYETPFYGTPSFKPVSHNTTYYLSSNFNAMFSVTDINISSKGKLMLLFNNKIIDLKSTSSKNGTLISGANNTIDIYYYETEIGYIGAMIKIEKKEILHFFIGRIYRSLGEIDEDGIQNIINARKAGWNFVDAYIIPCLKDECPTAKEQIELALNATIAKGAQIGILWISIPSLTCKEILPWPLYQNCNESWTNWPWSSNLTFNQAFILEMIKQAEAMGFRVGIYSSHLRWPSVVGKEWNGISDKPLWFARFVKDKKKYVNDFSVYSPFGGWAVPSMHNFEPNNSDYCNVTVNLSWYPE